MQAQPLVRAHKVDRAQATRESVDSQAGLLFPIHYIFTKAHQCGYEVMGPSALPGCTVEVASSATHAGQGVEAGGGFEQGDQKKRGLFLLLFSQGSTTAAFRLQAVLALMLQRVPVSPGALG